MSSMHFVSGLAAFAAFLMLAGCGSDEKAAVNAKVTTTTVSPAPNEDGLIAEEGDLVTVFYRGALASDGTIFDQNWEDPEKLPMVFGIGMAEVVPGFEEGVRGMKVGEVRKVQIPSALGYGSAGSGAIPPNADLEFEIKLLYIVKEDDLGAYDVESSTEGTGPAVKRGDTVSINYRITYLNGKLVDDSTLRAKPIGSFALDGKTVFPGIEAPLVGMKPGGKKTVVVPHSLMQGLGGLNEIEGKQPLRIELELISVNGQTS